MFSYSVFKPRIMFQIYKCIKKKKKRDKYDQYVNKIGRKFGLGGHDKIEQ